MPISVQSGTAVNAPYLTENHGVPGSNPSLATSKTAHLQENARELGLRRSRRREHPPQPASRRVSEGGRCGAKIAAARRLRPGPSTPRAPRVRTTEKRRPHEVAEPLEDRGPRLAGEVARITAVAWRRWWRIARRPGRLREPGSLTLAPGSRCAVPTKFFRDSSRPTLAAGSRTS
jgi:hypothetical protein